MTRPIKWRRIFAELANGHALTRFDAERLGDHVLPSTIYKIEQRTGISVNREMVTVPGWSGTVARVARYSLAPENRIRARVYLGGAA